MPHDPRTLRAARRTFVALALTILPSSMFVSGSAAAADPDTNRHWHLSAMNAEEMWKVSMGEGITVAVIDSDVDRSLPELKGQVLPTKNFSQEKDLTPAARQHGSSMAATIAGTGARSGIKGLAPKSKILPIVLHEDDLSIARGNSLPQAIDYAVKNSAKIINMSFGTSVWEDIPKQTQAAVHRAQRAGVLIFASAGNNAEQSNAKEYPAAIPGVIAVGATDREAKPAKFSTSGPHLALAAPGTDIPGRCKKNTTTCPNEGTSFATALTSASAALIWAKYPEWTNNQVLRALIQTAGRPGATADDPPNTHIGYGAIRPRLVLQGKADPGNPNQHPTFAKYYADLTTNSPSPTPTSQDTAAPENPTSHTATDKDSNTPVLVGAAVAAALLAGTFLLLVTRRRDKRPTTNA